MGDGVDEDGDLRWTFVELGFGCGARVLGCLTVLV